MLNPLNREAAWPETENPLGHNRDLLNNDDLGQFVPGVSSRQLLKEILANVVTEQSRRFERMDFYSSVQT